MTKLGIMLPTGERVEADIVRYFDAYGKKYLVYTLNEKDEQGFVKLYVAKIDGAPKALIGEFIGDDNEWSVLKGEFKKIIGENSDTGRTSANDLNPTDLENVNVRGHRIIKLMDSYVNLLGANKKDFDQPLVNNNVNQAPVYQAPAAPTYQQPYPNQTFNQPEPMAPIYPEMPMPNAPAYPESPLYSNSKFEFDGPAANAYQNPVTQDFQPEPPMAPVFPESVAPNNYTQPVTNNFEAMYNDVKAKLERCTAELEKVTNENIELRIKIDDIREILNEN